MKKLLSNLKTKICNAYGSVNNFLSINLRKRSIYKAITFACLGIEATGRKTEARIISKVCKNLVYLLPNNINVLKMVIISLIAVVCVSLELTLAATAGVIFLLVALYYSTTWTYNFFKNYESKYQSTVV